MQILKFTGEPRNWIFLFALCCQLVFFSPELMLLTMAISGSVWFYHDKKKLLLPAWADADKRALWLVPLCFVSVFGIKLLSVIWAIEPKQSLNNSFNSLHFLLWPALVIFCSRVNVSVRKTEPWVAASLLILMVWYLAALAFFPLSEDAQCFKAGAHNCGLLGQTLAFMLLWLFIAVTRPNIQNFEKMYLISALLAGWVAFLGTLRRTEILGLILGMGVVLLWRFKQNVSMKKVWMVCCLCVFSLLMAWPVMKPRFAVVSEEVALYTQGGAARMQALNTSVGARLEMYRIAFAAIQERPLLGWGAGLKPKLVPQFATDPSQPYGYSNFHQQYLQVILDVGMLGGGLALAVVIYLCRRMLVIPWQRGHHELAAILAALFFTYAWKALVNGALLYSVTNSVFVFYSALIWAELRYALVVEGEPLSKGDHAF